MRPLHALDISGNVGRERLDRIATLSVPKTSFH
jgi:hypothetical protein